MVSKLDTKLTVMRKMQIALCRGTSPYPKNTKGEAEGGNPVIMYKMLKKLERVWSGSYRSIAAVCGARAIGRQTEVQ